MSTQQAVPIPATIERELSLLDRIADEQAHAAARVMPTLTPKQFGEREKSLAQLREMLVEGVDYGTIPGTDKPTLLLPGAQKVCAYFGYVPDPERFDHPTVAIEDWTGAQYGEPLFAYRLVCALLKDGALVGAGLGSCSSWESKYRFRWVQEPPANLDKDTLPRRDSTLVEFSFTIDKAETGGQYGKPKDYWDRWKNAILSGEARSTTKKTKAGKELDAYEMGGTMYRIPNDQFADTINTVLKMAKKRAYIDATLSATGLSQYFTQDVEDHQDDATPARRDVAQAGDKGNGRSNADAKAPSTPASDGASRHETKRDERPVPEELRDAVSKLRVGDFSVIKNATTYLQDEIIKACGTEGPYLKEAGKLRDSYPKPQVIPTEAMVSMWLDCWAIIGSARFANDVNS